MRTIQTSWEVTTYDVWGNKKDGYEVNDAYRRGSVDMRLKVQTANKGMRGEFTHASPSDYQLKKVFGVGCRIRTDGDDLCIYVNRDSDDYPFGELRCTSHESLSPIRVA